MASANPRRIADACGPAAQTAKLYSRKHSSSEQAVIRSRFCLIFYEIVCWLAIKCQAELHSAELISPTRFDASTYKTLCSLVSSQGSVKIQRWVRLLCYLLLQLLNLLLFGVIRLNATKFEVTISHYVTYKANQILWNNTILQS